MRSTKDTILEQARQKGTITTSEVVKLTGISRQTIAEHFRRLIKEKKLIKTGSTHNAKYMFPADKTFQRDLFKEKTFINEYPIKGLSEDIVFQEAVLTISLSRQLSPNAYKIVNYAFTEMLNNAIDHSRSKKVKIYLKCLNGEFEFGVTDFGVGAFENIRKKFRLKNHFQAIEHLLKGKQTTDPKRHTGQGIFFTSKISDRFILESAKIALIIDNKLEDIFVKDIKNVTGTRVKFYLKQKSRKNLGDLFKEFQNNEYEFDKTKLQVIISLSAKENEYISRSEAKRLLFGLEKFKRIILNFKKVRAIGQSFADEIFRVFKKEFPKIKVETINTSPSVEFMIKRVKS